MRTKTMTGICVALIAMAIGASSVWAAKKKAVAEVELNAAGQKLLARYSGQLKALNLSECIVRYVINVRPTESKQ